MELDFIDVVEFQHARFVFLIKILSLSRASLARLWFKTELDRLRARFGAKIIHARFERSLPAVKVHRRQLRVGRLLHEQVHRLALIDEMRSVGRVIDDTFHADFPHRLIERLDVVRNVRDVLHRAPGSNDQVFHLFGPKACVF